MRRVEDLTAEAKLSEAQVGNLGHLEREARRLEAELTQERHRVRSLTDELKRPINVHRWRALEVTEPDKFKLIKRAAALRRRVMEAQDEAAKRDLEVQEKERLYVELKQVLARQPGPEVEEQVLAYEGNLK